MKNKKSFVMIMQMNANGCKCMHMDANASKWMC